jgi:hypothetical protein
MSEVKLVLTSLERVKGNGELTKFFCVNEHQLLILPDFSFPKNGYILICKVFVLDNLSFTNFTFVRNVCICIVLNKFFLI